MTKSPWWLRAVGDSLYSQWADDLSANFYRRTTSTAGQVTTAESITIVVESDGLTKAYRNGVLQGLKPHRRARLHDLCCQANAYVRMVGSVEGFPEVESL